MAATAQAGPIAGTGFAGLTIATAFCVSMTAWNALKRQYDLHRRWATRTYLLLCSPLLLRLIAGATIVAELDNVWTYRANAWVSWIGPLIGPLIGHEIQNWRRSATVVRGAGAWYRAVTCRPIIQVRAKMNVAFRSTKVRYKHTFTKRKATIKIT